MHPGKTKVGALYYTVRVASILFRDCLFRDFLFGDFCDRFVRIPAFAFRELHD